MARRTIALLLLPAVFAACSTDLEVSAPYKDITVVYGVLSTRAADGTSDETRHYVKINKAFLGEGDALVYAQIADSTEYDDPDFQVAPRVVDLDNNAEFLLNDTMMPREPGVFNSPLHKVYYFDATLDPEHTYAVRMKVRGNEVGAETPIVNPPAYQSGFLQTNSNSKLNLMLGNQYNTVDMDFRSGRDARRYDVSYRVRYAEDRSGVLTEESYTVFLGSVRTNGLNGGEELQVAISGEAFYQNMATVMENDPSITRRIYRGLDILFAAASDEFATYLTLAQPVSGIVEERPEYTNITNGFGLFAGRHFQTAVGVKLGDASLVQLVDGPYTAPFNFCIEGNGPPLGCD